MAEMFEQLLQHLGTGSELEQISDSLGADQATTQRAIAAALPSLLGALANNAQEPQGAQSLFGALDDHDGSAVDNVAGLFGGGGDDAMAAIGGKILGHVFGGNQDNASSAVAQKSGLNGDLVKKLLPLLAPIVMGYLGKRKSEEGFGLDDLISVLTNERQQTVEKEPGLGGLLDAVTGGGGGGGALGGLLGGNDSPLGSILGKVLGG